MGRGVVVVGVGLVPDERVVRWAAGEARDRDLVLRLVHALVLPVGDHSGWALRRRARQALDDAAATAHDVAPDLEVETVTTEGGPAPVLRSQAVGAALVAVGGDGPGRFGDLLLGGAVRGLVGHVDVPVVVVPVGYDASAPRGDHAPVLVGDDGTAGCTGAWRFAADRAQRRGAPLVAVRVVGDDHVDRVLVDRARGAEVLVLGVDDTWFRHRTAPGVVRHAVCPVVVVPPVPAAAEPVEGVVTASRG